MPEVLFLDLHFDRTKRASRLVIRKIHGKDSLMYEEKGHASILMLRYASTIGDIGSMQLRCYANCLLRTLNDRGDSFRGTKDLEELALAWTCAYLTNAFIPGKDQKASQICPPLLSYKDSSTLTEPREVCSSIFTYSLLLPLPLLRI